MSEFIIKVKTTNGTATVWKDVVHLQFPPGNPPFAVGDVFFVESFQNTYKVLHIVRGFGVASQSEEDKRQGKRPESFTEFVPILYVEKIPHPTLEA